MLWAGFDLFMLVVIAWACLVSSRATSDEHGRFISSRSQAPKVTINNGTIIGKYSVQYNQDLFLGVPYAQPPIRNLRFSPPQPLGAFNETINAVSLPPYCAQSGKGSEDCLYLNIVRPSGYTSANGSGLPVGLWIHGGGLVSDGAADQLYNMSFIIQNSAKMQKPIIGISIGYRLSSWGFLGGKEVLQDGSSNLGFRDQRLALKWVQENIGQFGGDKDKVTIFGESAGAASVWAHLLAYGGRNENLFRGAIAQSGYFPVTSPGTTSQQSGYDSIVKATSCASTLGQSSSLSCLRSLSFSELNTAINAHGGASPQVDGDFIKTVPADQLNSGDVVAVPAIFGANSDEGTAFFSGGVSTDAQFENLVRPYSSNSSVVAMLLVAYPNNDSEGIPSLETYSGTFDTEGSQYRRAAAFTTDSFIMAARRRMNQAWSVRSLTSYSYRWDITRGGESAKRGATHGSEVPFVFDDELGVGYDLNPFTSGLSSDKVTELKRIGKLISQTWIAFIHDLDPNANGIAGSTTWPVYKTATQNLVWRANGTYVETDNFRAAGIQLLSYK